MTQSNNQVPDSLSTGELQQLLASASKEPSVSNFEEQTVETASTLLGQIKDGVTNEMVAKLMVLIQLTNLLMWADQNMEEAKSQGEMESYSSYRSLRDRIADVHNTLCNIQMHENDFTVPSEE